MLDDQSKPEQITVLNVTDVTDRRTDRTVDPFTNELPPTSHFQPIKLEQNPENGKPFWPASRDTPKPDEEL